VNNPKTHITSTVPGLHFFAAGSIMRSSPNFQTVFSKSQNANPLDAEPETHFYRAMHFSANARSWDRMSSVCASVRLSVCDVGEL